MELNEVIARIKTEPEGTNVVYHVGFLAKDKMSDCGKDLALLSNAVYECYLDGFCSLTQKRVSSGKYRYIATILDEKGRTLRAKKNRSLHDTLRIKSK